METNLTVHWYVSLPQPHKCCCSSSCMEEADPEGEIAQLRKVPIFLLYRARNIRAEIMKNLIVLNRKPEGAFKNYRRWENVSSFRKSL